MFGETASAQYSSELLRRAQDGDVDAQYSVGDAYYYGEGVEQDYAEAVKWYRLAAEQGDVWAQIILGYVYYRCEGVKQDFAEAIKWWQMAAEQGHKVAALLAEECAREAYKNC